MIFVAKILGKMGKERVISVKMRVSGWESAHVINNPVCRDKGHYRRVIRYADVRGKASHYYPALPAPWGFLHTPPKIPKQNDLER